MARDISEDTRFRVLWVLQEDPDLSQREIASHLGLSLGAINYCLRALIRKGQVKVRNFRAADNKLRYSYLLTPRGVAEKSRLTAGFLKRKLAEFEALKTEIEALKQQAAKDTEPHQESKWQ